MVSLWFRVIRGYLMLFEKILRYPGMHRILFASVLGAGICSLLSFYFFGLFCEEKKIVWFGFVLLCTYKNTYETHETSSSHPPFVSDLLSQHWRLSNSAISGGFKSPTPRPKNRIPNSQSWTCQCSPPHTTSAISARMS